MVAITPSNLLPNPGPIMDQRGVLHTGGRKVNVFDVETTGLDPKTDRIISLGLVEISGGQITNRYEWFFNPGDVPINPEALAVHGITAEFLKDKPPIRAHLADILGLMHQALAGGHNSSFDLGFIEAELSRNRFPRLTDFIAGTFCTMEMSKRKFPGKRASLDELCKRLGISIQHRQLHGALLDAELCAQALLVMNREQISLLGEAEPSESQQSLLPIDAADMIVLRATDEELAEHDAYLNDMAKQNGTPPIWATLEEQAQAEEETDSPEAMPMAA